MNSEFDIVELISASAYHMKALRAVKMLDLPDWWIGAGFVRNYVWDNLHGYAEMTPLNDIDVIYYDPDDLTETREKALEKKLRGLMPGQPWSVKNQARMHLKNNDPPYTCSTDALSRWCETPTAIGVALDSDDRVIVTAPHGIEDLVHLECRPVPHYVSPPERLAIYRQRVNGKNWNARWPHLTIHDAN